jgi:glycosyltransferase involved in cell wall biosynthesis
VGDYAWEQGVQRFGVSELLDDFLKKSYGWRIRCLRKIQYATAYQARGVIVPSEYLKRVIMAWGIDAKKIHVIANACELETISESHEDLRKILSLSGIVLLSAGRLVPWKGFKLLIELMPELMRDHRDMTLLIAGSGPQKEELESLIAAKGLNNHVKLLGPVAHADFLRYIKAVDVFILATAYEGLSHTVLEAMAMGALVIASNIGGNPELIEHNKNGFLFNLNDHRKIIQTIRETLALPKDKKIAISQAAIMNSSRYTRERMIKATAHYMLSL